MEENNNQSLGQTLIDIRKKRGDVRTRIVFDEETQDFVIKPVDEPLEEGQQDATEFAGEGFA